MTYRRTNPLPRYIAFAAPSRQLQVAPHPLARQPTFNRPVGIHGLVGCPSWQSQPVAATPTTPRASTHERNHHEQQHHQPARPIPAAAIATTAIIFGAAACGSETGSDIGEPAAPAAPAAQAPPAPHAPTSADAAERQACGGGVGAAALAQEQYLRHLVTPCRSASRRGVAARSPSAEDDIHQDSPPHRGGLSHVRPALT